MSVVVVIGGGGGAGILITSRPREFAADRLEFHQQEFGSLHFTTETATRSVCVCVLYIYIYVLPFCVLHMLFLIICPERCC